MKLRTVLLPVEFTDETALVVAFARGLSSLGVRRVVLAHVVAPDGPEGGDVAGRVDAARARMEELSTALKDAGLGIEVRVAVGDAVDELGALAAEAQVDAAVYGSHAKSITDQLLVGSVSERLVRDADVPQLVARFDLLRNQADPASLLQHFGEKLVLATDFSLSASRAFMRVIELPKGVVKHIFLLHAVDPGLTGEKLRRAEEGAEFHMRNLRAVCAQAGIPASVTLRKESAVNAVLAELDERRATGVVVGTRGCNAVQEMLLGSLSMTLIRQASCPVLIVP
ncbi:MAG TPA: universal stress protein [Coriobacteriia bacterium]|nr:universal stress protein [Coriobacteriia bacterium]